MSTVPIRQTAPPTVGNSSRSFVVAGFLAIIATALVMPLGGFNWLPAIGRLLQRGGTVSAIAVFAVAITLWILLFIVARLFSGGQDRADLTRVNSLASTTNGAEANGRALSELRRGLRPNSLLARRLAAVASQAPQDRDDAAFNLAANSELDHARGDVSYLPARALVWALPALGFLGTAAEMSRAIGSLGDTVGGTTGYSELRNALVSKVIPPLADAFGMTLFALGAAVVCHVLLTWTNGWEQRILLGVEEATLRLLPTVPAASQSGPALNGDVDRLSEEISLIRSAMRESAEQVASMDFGQLSELRQLAQVVPLLQETNHRLDRIHAELGRELVISRGLGPEKRG